MKLLKKPAEFLESEGNADPKVQKEMLGNALKFTPDGGKILLSAKEKDDSMEVRVRDTGIRIEKDKLVRIFDKFYQVYGPSRRKTGGRVLGFQ